MRQRLIHIIDGVPGSPASRMARSVYLDLYEGEHWAIVGDNAAGKTRLMHILNGESPLPFSSISYDFSPSERPLLSDNIKSISFHDSYGSSDSSYYLQKRWNQQDIDPEDNPTLGRVLQRIPAISEDFREDLYRFFGIEPMLGQYLISLSSGELRKYQLVKALLTLPRVLILDNPFIGLDVQTRECLSTLLGELSKRYPLSIILILPRPEDLLPSFITHVIEVKDLLVGPKWTREQYLQNLAIPRVEQVEMRTAIENEQEDCARAEIIRTRKMRIAYGGRTILQTLDWVVREGDKWIISGENGSGKSTLLSCICADNPQSYACDIELFSRRRGSGESIWDIKRHIGYVSPEMHRAYQKDILAEEVVASGFFDTIGSTRRLSDEQEEICRKWMKCFGIEHLYGRRYLRISSGEQRLCLLARAFVKEPPLLILDEPMHGLDAQHSARVREIIDAYMQDSGKTLLMVSHFPSEYPSCIDHELHLRKG